MITSKIPAPTIMGTIPIEAKNPDSWAGAAASVGKGVASTFL